MEGEDRKNEISTYLENLKEALRLALKSDMSEGLIKAIGVVHEGIIELEPYLKTDADHKRLKGDVEKLINSLRLKCKEGDQSALGEIRQLRDRIKFLKHKFTQ